MKNNQDKLTDAVGMLDEETLQEAMTHAGRMNRHASVRRRAMVLLAACLSLVLMAGAILAVPLMTADDPTVTDPPVGDTSVLPATDESPERFYTEVPMVKFSMLSANESVDMTTPTPSATPVDRAQVSNIADYLGRSFLILSFDCEAGETVTVKAGMNSLHLVELPLTEDTDTGLQGELWAALEDIYDENAQGTNTLTVDPAVSCILVRMPHSYTELDEDRLDFTVRDGDGQAMGAGSIYLGTRFLVSLEECRLQYEKLALTRSAVLGSVRFDDPASVTEEQIAALMASFAIETDAAKAALDYTPATPAERALTAEAAIIKEMFVGEQITSTQSSSGSHWEFTLFYVVETNRSNATRGFILFADGSWGEFITHENCMSSQCHGSDCPNAAENGCLHGIMVGCRFTLTDGRIYEIREEEYEGRTVEVLVLVSETDA